MSEDMETRIQEAERRARDVIQRIERLASLQETMAESNESLSASAARVEGVVETAQQIATTLGEALRAFREVTDVLRASDPARVLETQERAERRLEDLQRSVDTMEGTLRDTNQTADKIQGDVRNLGVDVSERIATIGPEVETLLERLTIDVSTKIAGLNVDVSEKIEEAARVTRTVRVLACVAVLGSFAALVMLLLR